MAIYGQRGFILSSGGKCRPGAMERAMRDVEYDRIVDAVRKEIALAPMEFSLAGLWTADGRPRTAGEKHPVRRHPHSSVARVRRLGERQKRYR